VGTRRTTLAKLEFGPIARARRHRSGPLASKERVAVSAAKRVSAGTDTGVSLDRAHIVSVTWSPK
jgi:hypothetical protein